MLNRSRILATLSAAAALSMPAVVPAQDEGGFDRTPIDCIAINAIDKTDVIDDQTIVFVMRGKRIYRNYLPRECPRLEEEDRFGYRVTSGRLCSIDMITVLGKFAPGFTCRLGDFQPITAEEFDELRAIRDDLPAQDGVQVEAVDPPEEDSADSQEEASETGGDADRENSSDEREND